MGNAFSKKDLNTNTITKPELGEVNPEHMDVWVSIVDRAVKVMVNTLNNTKKALFTTQDYADFIEQQNYDFKWEDIDGPYEIYLYLKNPHTGKEMHTVVASPYNFLPEWLKEDESFADSVEVVNWLGAKEDAPVYIDWERNKSAFEEAAVPVQDSRNRKERREK